MRRTVCIVRSLDKDVQFRTRRRRLAKNFCETSVLVGQEVGFFVIAWLKIPSHFGIGFAHGSDCHFYFVTVDCPQPGFNLCGAKELALHGTKELALHGAKELALHGAKELALHGTKELALHR